MLPSDVTTECRFCEAGKMLKREQVRFVAAARSVADTTTPKRNISLKLIFGNVHRVTYDLRAMGAAWGYVRIFPSDFKKWLGD